jgi:hypothetical protein
MADSLADRVQLLEDERDILRTMYDYAHALDYGLEEEFLDCFTDDGVWRSVRRSLVGRPDTPGRFCEGREGLIGFFTQHTHAPKLYHKHLVADPRVRLAGDEAQVDSYFVRIDEHPDGSYVRAFGRYHDRLTRCADRRWRIKERSVEIEDWIQRQYPAATSP